MHAIKVPSIVPIFETGSHYREYVHKDTSQRSPQRLSLLTHMLFRSAHEDTNTDPPRYHSDFFVFCSVRSDTRGALHFFRMSNRWISGSVAPEAIRTPPGDHVPTVPGPWACFTFGVHPKELSTCSGARRSRSSYCTPTFLQRHVSDRSATRELPKIPRVASGSPVPI